MTLDLFLAAYTPKPGDIIVEAGAGTGTETPALAELVGADGLVLAIEPHPVSFAALRFLTAPLPNVRAVLGAVLAERGHGFMTDEADPMLNRVSSDGTIAINVYTLDELTDDLDRVDLLKMNIEGSEVAALHGAAATLTKTRNLVIACHDFLGMPTRAAVYELLGERFELHGPPPTVPASAWAADYVYGVRRE